MAQMDRGLTLADISSSKKSILRTNNGMESEPL
jgi:hypothetical protein